MLHITRKNILLKSIILLDYYCIRNCSNVFFDAILIYVFETFISVVNRLFYLLLSSTII